MAKKRQVSPDDACPFPSGVELPNRFATLQKLSPAPPKAPAFRNVAILGAVILLLTLGASYIQWVNQLNSGLPLEPSLVTDKEQYRVGETIHATLRYYNPNKHSVSFTHSDFVFAYANMSSQVPETTVEVIRHVQGTPWVVVGADSYYELVMHDFVAISKGTEVIHLGNLMKQVEIIE